MGSVSIKGEYKYSCRGAWRRGSLLGDRRRCVIHSAHTQVHSMALGREAQTVRSSSLWACESKTFWEMHLEQREDQSSLSSVSSWAYWTKSSTANPERWWKWGDVKSPRKHMAQPGIRPRAAKECFGIFTLPGASSPAPAADPLVTASHERPVPGKCPLCCCGLGVCETGILHCLTSYGSQIYNSSGDQVLNLYKLSKCLFSKILFQELQFFVLLYF